jgi:hypothetical protein
VLDHLTDEHKPAVAKRLHAAYALEDHAAAKQAWALGKNDPVTLG